MPNKYLPTYSTCKRSCVGDAAPAWEDIGDSLAKAVAMRAGYQAVNLGLAAGSKAAAESLGLTEVKSKSPLTAITSSNIMLPVVVGSLLVVGVIVVVKMRKR